MRSNQKKKSKVERQSLCDVFIEEIPTFLVKFYREKGFVEFRRLIKIFCTSLQNKDEQVAKKLTDLFNNYTYGTYSLKLKQYFISVLLSRDYQHFKKTTPMELVRMARFYLGKKGKSFPLKMTPFLIKLARKVKYNVSKQVLTLHKKEPLRDEEDVFNEVKNKMLKKKLTFTKKRKP